MKNVTAILGFFLGIFLSHVSTAQESSGGTPSANFEGPNTLVWKGTYSTIRIGERLYWEAQHHYRRGAHDGVPWIGRMTQIYNRHALTYKFSKNFIFTLGPVLRINFTPEPGNDDFRTTTLEPRVWHQYAFPLNTLIGNRQVVIQHRLRFEHRWNRSNLRGSEFIYRDRYRYRFTMKMPMGKKQLQPNTWYLMPLNVEIIMQSGREVVDAPFEDLRIYPAVGYIFSTKVAYSIGMMYTTGQRRPDFNNNVMRGEQYRQRWILRANLWWTPDFRKFKDKVPDIGIMD